MPEENVIFGTHDTPALRLLNHNARRQGVQHDAHLEPRDPCPGEPVTLVVWTGSDVNPISLGARYTLDGSLPTPSSPEVMFRCVATEWDSLSWGYRRRWEATLPGQPAGTTVRYRICGPDPGLGLICADWPPVEEVIMAETRRYFGDEAATPRRPAPDAERYFTYVVDTFAPPDWARDALLYQIFVDRFAAGAGRALASGEDLSGFFGGTLRGIIEALDYVADLGFNTLWLSPIFPSPTHHGYDTTDYFDVEPRLGTLADFRQLVEEAHRRGMRVILDLALNHASDQHPLFRQALENPQSEYARWFRYDTETGTYPGYFGVRSMPEWDIHYPPVREYLLGVGRFWLEQGADGFRLDYADGPGPGFWSEFRAACRAVNSEAWLFSEIVQPPDVLAPYHGRLDGSLDFLWEQQVRRAVAHGALDAEGLARFLDAHRATLSPDFLRPVFLDNHDIDRFLLAAGNDLRRLRLALLLLFTWPQPPILFYGTETALQQPRSSRDPGMGLEASRVPMQWDVSPGGEALRADVRALAALRRAHPDLIRGERTTLTSDVALWLFSCRGTQEILFVALNLSEHEAAFSLPAPTQPLWTAGELTLEGRKGRLGPLSAVVLKRER